MEQRRKLDGGFAPRSSAGPDQSRENFTTLHCGKRGAFRRLRSAV
jgi:hypothetical protein